MLRILVGVTAVLFPLRAELKREVGSTPDWSPANRSAHTDNHRHQHLNLRTKRKKKSFETGSAFLLFESIPWYLTPLSFLMELHNSLRLNPISTRCSNPVKMRWHIFYVVKVNYKKINTKRLQGTPSQFHCRHDVYFYVHKSNISNGNYGGGRRYRGKLSDSLVRITSFAGIPPGVTVQLSDCCGFVLTSMQSHKFIGNISEAEFLFL